MITPTKNAVSPRVWTTGSIAPTRISDRIARRIAAPTRTTAAVRPVQPGPSWVSRLVAAERRRGIGELVD
jgi:hypothetical protein